MNFDEESGELIALPLQEYEATTHTIIEQITL